MKKISFQRQVFIGFAISLALVFTINYLSYKSTTELTVNARLITHTQEVINKGSAVYVLMLNAETGQRGFVITGNETYLETYNNAIGQFEKELDVLSDLINDNPKQIVTVDSIRENANKKIVEMQYVIKLRREYGFTQAQNRVSTNIGKELMEGIRAGLTSLNNEEMRLLSIREDSTAKSTSRTYLVIIIGGILVLAILLLMFVYITRTFRLQREAEALIKSTNTELEIISNENILKNWMLTGSANLNEKMRGEQSLSTLSDNVVKLLANYLDARLGTFYLYDKAINELVLTGTFAFPVHKAFVRNVKPGEGLVGQCILDKSIIVYKDIPADYVKIQSSLGNALPQNILIAPLYSGNTIQGVIELAFDKDIDQTFLDFIELINENIAIAIQSAKAREVMQQQSEELQAQQEELQQTNEELTSQASLLQASEEELRVQQEELQQTNVELEEKAAQLEERNEAIEQAKESIAQKAAELEQTNKYKSEFLANMSHELRTPLNSILILAKLLSENKNNTLLENEVKFASVIYNSGNDLLTLINDILDLSKIESGKLDMNFEEHAIQEVAEDLHNMFGHVAENKKILFVVDQQNEISTSIVTDKLRLEQVLRNLLSNAFKFTSQGGNITLKIYDRNEKICFAVVDNGIGIPDEKQKLIFDAFQQADGTTSRKYGGTGLGLSISRELASLLGGTIELQSKVGEGSTFSLTIPYQYKIGNELNTSPSIESSFIKPAKQLTSRPEDLSDKILIIEDDVSFASILKDYATEKGFISLIAYDGEDGLALAKEHKPRAILLDIMLPLKSGWEVLKELKNDETLKHIPVHIMSANDSFGAEATLKGALSFVEKPVSANRLEKLFLSVSAMFGEEPASTRKVLIIEDNEIENKQLATLLDEHSIESVQAFTGKQGLAFLDTHKFDLVILDLKLPDMEGLDVLKEIKSSNEHRLLPVFINTAMDIPKHVQTEIMRYSNAFVVKNKRSNERLMDEIRLFVNKVKTEIKPVTNQTGSNSSSNQFSNRLKGKKVLLADDDMRNVFALSSILQQYDLEVEIAANGVEVLDKLKTEYIPDIVLMDIMMPIMDGYEAMRKIRLMKGYNELPIIALTAKAMKNDRERCMEAGASDYLPKPVDTDKLLSLMRVWLSK